MSKTLQISNQIKECIKAGGVAGKAMQLALQNISQKNSINGCTLVIPGSVLNGEDDEITIRGEADKLISGEKLLKEKLSVLVT
jgi:hypothetical protein